MKLQVIRQRGLWWTLSSILIMIGIVAMIILWKQIGTPLRPSLDFVGGTRLQFELDCTKPGSCDKPIDVGVVRDVMAAEGHANSSIQTITNRQGQQVGVTIRTPPLTGEQRNQIQAILSTKLGALDPAKTQIDTVGPVIGQQLFTSGLMALIVSFVGITIYLSMRFQLDYAVFAIIALFHDVLITVGAFAVLGLLIGTEVDTLFVVALLTIVGFSVNDTVVIYDRVRETLAQHPTMHIDDVVDTAVNSTLARSINTTVTVLLTLFSIFLFGGETLKNFALALIIGFTMGAYSSIFIASTLLAFWRERTGQVYGPTTVATEVAEGGMNPEDVQ